jgi:hypothetical protein
MEGDEENTLRGCFVEEGDRSQWRGRENAGTVKS